MRTHKNYKILTFIFVSLNILLNCDSNQEFTHDRKRVSELQKVEHECLQKFKVGENSIIRTQDSMELGAKFLKESDVGNREDCLNLCCNTRFCNVAVFEEKSSFSCYLFDCGGPNNFRCKFTPHTFYTSAMLNDNRHQLDLRLLSSQHQHESELTNLRSSINEEEAPVPEASLERVPSIGTQPKIMPPQDKGEDTTLPPSTTVPISSSSLASPTKPSKSQTDRNCHRFQFECHSGECLAIYNACDGIPQCQDGSDEGPDLGCPQGSAAGQDDSAPQSQPTKAESLPLQGISQYSWNAQNSNRRNDGKDRGSSLYTQRTGNTLEYPNNESPAYGRDDGLNYNGGALSSKPVGYYDYNLRSPQSIRYPGNQMDIGNGDSSSLYLHEYPDYGYQPHQQEHSLQHLPKQHQSPLQQGLSNGAQQQFQQRPMIARGQNWPSGNARYPYPLDQGNQNGMSLQQSLQMGQQPNMPMPRLQQPSYSQQTLYDGSKNMGLLGGQKQQPGHLSLDLNMNSPYLTDLNDPSRVSIKEAISEVKNTPTIDKVQRNNNSSIKKELGKSQSAVGGGNTASDDDNDPKVTSSSAKGVSHDSSQPKTPKNMTSTSTDSETPKSISQSNQTKQHSNPKNSLDELASHLSVSHLEIDLKELQIKEEEKKSEASGAVLALSLGICVTALLVLLVGCRMKNAKRRMRRHRGGRSPLEHDSDYLVNGMYL